ncbi:MAG: helix-turn-helix domain-containing protein [Candidatus Thermoplasmatota archaeon]|nr:helix-turn-helix domain-containing protein [Candidatus Thermoplasmatota archaeon]
MERELKEKIAGELTLTRNFGATMRKWRNRFNVAQKDLAYQTGVSPSVISDYESGRRKSPGIATVRKIVDALIDIDKQRGGEVIKEYMLNEHTEVVFGMSEFPRAVDNEDFLELINGQIVNREYNLKDLHGYTVIDSLKAILQLTSYDYLRIYGWSTQRALLFTDVQFGRSPMIAIRAHPLKPAMVVYLQPEKVDTLAIKLADLEHLPLVESPMSVAEVMTRLSRFRENMDKEEEE